MELTRYNYESFFIDFLDKKLSEEEVSIIHQFMVDNPDLAQELEEGFTEFVPDTELLFSGKASLKKHAMLSVPVNQFNFDEYCIACIENDLSENEIKALNNFISINPAKVHDLNIFRKTILKPDYSSLYFNKHQIRRPEILSKHFIKLFYSLASIAAVLLLAFIIVRTIYKEPVNWIEKDFTLVHRKDMIAPLVKNTYHLVNPISRKFVKLPKNTVMTKVMNNNDSSIVVSREFITDYHILESKKYQLIETFIGNEELTLKSLSNLEVRPQKDRNGSLFAKSILTLLHLDVLKDRYQRKSLDSLQVDGLVDRINKFADGQVMIVKKKEHGRSIISFQTRIFSFYQSIDN
jgi:hypothetical protein